MFGDDERTVVGRLGDGIPDIRHVGYRTPLVHAVAARRLRTTLQNVPGDDARGHLVPVIRGPAEFVAEGRHRERRIRAAADHDDVGTERQRFHDWIRTDVGVRRHHATADRRQRFTGVHILELMPSRHEVVEARKNIVARYHADADLAAHAVLRGCLEQGLGTGHRIHAASIGDHLDAAFRDGWEHAFHGADKVARVAHAGITFFLLLQNRHRDFSEVVEHQVIHLTTFHLTTRRFQPVAPEALTAGDADHAR